MPESRPPTAENLLRNLPQVEKLLRLPAVEAISANGSRVEVADALRALLEETRQDLLQGKVAPQDLTRRVSEEGVVKELKRTLKARRLATYRRVVNATGVILHTGLGRAVLSEAAVEAVVKALSGYSVVEVELEGGERNQREEALTELLGKLTGAESATVVNNNAAATLLILASIARGKEVIVSRGQLVEIGGSFRIPDVLKESGARLVEVGTTNRTYVKDYRRAVGPETALLLQVHTSNYAISGFVHHTPLEDLVALGKECGLPVVSDLGSGCFVDLSPYGFKPEPLVSESIQAGADLVCFSGDKLLGGPQSGIILGTKNGISKLRAHPLFRTLRVDKATLTLLEATLKAYQYPDKLKEILPTLRAITEPAQSVHRRALACCEIVRRAAPDLEVDVVPSSAQAGSGALPAQEIPSFAMAVHHATLSPDALAKELRLGNPPIFTRIHENRVLLDFRTVLAGEDLQIAAALGELLPPEA
jgi:L-seryl-tRNA(Ser) seleniumtransferase